MAEWMWRLKLSPEELKNVAGGDGYDNRDWIVTCPDCGSRFVIPALQTVVCPTCSVPINTVHGEGNPKPWR